MSFVARTFPEHACLLEPPVTPEAKTSGQGGDLGRGLRPGDALWSRRWVR